MPPRSTRSSGRAGRPPAGADVAAAPAPAPASSEDAAAAQPEPSQLGKVSGSTKLQALGVAQYTKRTRFVYN
eukprot:COSAG02_NODE_16897_length_1046_cov_1.649419_1_plen_72_part_00